MVPGGGGKGGGVMTGEGRGNMPPPAPVFQTGASGAGDSGTQSVQPESPSAAATAAMGKLNEVAKLTPPSPPAPGTVTTTILVTWDDMINPPAPKEGEAK
jgi:hypothetical protein